MTRRAGWTFVSVGVMGEGAGLGPYSFWSRREGERGRRVGWTVSSLSEGCGGGWVVDFAEVLGELMCVFGEGTMMRGEAERAAARCAGCALGLGGAGGSWRERGHHRHALLGSESAGCAGWIVSCCGQAGEGGDLRDVLG